MRRTNNPAKKCQYKRCKFTRMKRMKYCENHVDLLHNDKPLVKAIHEVYKPEEQIVIEKFTITKRIKNFIWK